MKTATEFRAASTIKGLELAAAVLSLNRIPTSSNVEIDNVQRFIYHRERPLTRCVEAMSGAGIPDEVIQELLTELLG